MRLWTTAAGRTEYGAIAEAWTADVVAAIAALPADERGTLESEPVGH